MASNLKPILHSISAFDAEFGSKGKENITAPIFKFSWEDGVVVHKNRVQIIDYKTEEIVYDYTITTRSLSHKLSRDNGIYKLKNGEKYKARVYVTTADGEESSPSNESIFYCYDTPIFEFTNFTEDESMISSGEEYPVVKNTSLNLSVKYSQINNEPLVNYSFELKDSNNVVQYTSDTKYSSFSNGTIRHSIGGLVNDATYTIGCSGETQHGMYIHTEQKFVVKLENSGVGALLQPKNIGDGTIVISSNYRTINVNYVGNEIKYYIKYEGVEPVEKETGISLLEDDYVEYIKGFKMKEPYEIIFSGDFRPGRLITLKNTKDENIGYISLKKIDYTTKPYYCFSFETTKNNICYEIRTEYFDESYFKFNLVSAEIDFIYKDNWYDIKFRRRF